MSASEGPADEQGTGEAPRVWWDPVTRQLVTSMYDHVQHAPTYRDIADVAPLAVELRPAPPAPICRECDETIVRCTAHHPDYGFTCMMPPGHRWPHYDEAGGGHWDSKGQLGPLPRNGARIVSAYPDAPPSPSAPESAGDAEGSRESLVELIEAQMPGETVHSREYGTVQIAPDVGDLADALLAAGWRRPVVAAQPTPEDSRGGPKETAVSLGVDPEPPTGVVPGDSRGRCPFPTLDEQDRGAATSAWRLTPDPRASAPPPAAKPDRGGDPHPIPTECGPECADEHTENWECAEANHGLLKLGRWPLKPGPPAAVPDRGGRGDSDVTAAEMDRLESMYQLGYATALEERTAAPSQPAAPAQPSEDLIGRMARMLYDRYDNSGEFWWDNTDEDARAPYLEQARSLARIVVEGMS